MTPRMVPTDEPEVTDETRFWLFFETTATSYRYEGRELYVRHHEPIRINVEVDEAAYRSAYAEQTGHAPDITMPLDDHWWSARPVGTGDPGYSLRRTRGGYIDWWGRS